MSKAVWIFLLLALDALGCFIIYLGVTGDQLVRSIGIAVVLFGMGVYPALQLRNKSPGDAPDADEATSD